MTATHSPLVSVVVVTYNSAHVVSQCLRLLQDDPTFEIIVVDNASTDGTMAVVAREAPHALVLDNVDNVGFAQAVNRGASYAKGKFILLLNPDAQIGVDGVHTLLKALDERPWAAVAAPWTDEGDGAFATIAAGHAPSIYRMATHAFGLSRFAKWFPILEGHYLLKSHVKRDVTRYVTWVSGGCMVVKTPAWRQLGGLSERWFMYAEDVEFCLRLRDVGLRVLLVPSAEATHQVGGSSIEVGGSSIGVHGRINTAWIENLFDLYRMRSQESRWRAWLWKTVVLAGFQIRVFVIAISAAARRRPVDNIELSRFRAYAESLKGNGKSGQKA